MVRVTERYGLFARLRRARDIVGAAQLEYKPGGKSEDKHGPKDGDPRERVRTVAKDLGHGLSLFQVRSQECVVSH